MLFDIQNVVILNSKKEEIGFASGDAILLALKDFAERGKGKVLVFSSSAPAGEKVSLAMGHGGDLQIEYPPCK